MPWTGRQFQERHNRKLNKRGAAKASSIANAIMRDGGDEGVAIATANRYADRHSADLRHRGIISERAAKRRGL